MQFVPRAPSGTQAPQSHQGQTIFTTTEATFFDPKLDLTSLETQSIISYATTARDLEGKPAELPPPPAAALDGEDFVCPYCFVLCPSAHGQGRAWRKHILQDLQPYSCIQINCSSADRLYGSRREWLEHEELQHRRIWVCRFHPSVWFSHQQAFEQHLRNEDHGNVTETQIKDFASIAQSTTNDLREQCPICLEDAASIPQFSAHLAHHLERIATFSIPRELDHEDSTSLASSRAVPRSMSDRASISLESSPFSSKNSTEDIDPNERILLNDNITGASPILQKADLTTPPSILKHDTYDSELPSQIHSGPMKDQIVGWLKRFADLVTPKITSPLLNSKKYQQFLGDSSFMSWYTGSLPRRILCYGLDGGRNTRFACALYDYLRQSLPGAPVVLCHLLATSSRNLEIKDILAFILGQLITYTSAETIPTELLQLYDEYKTSGRKPPRKAVAHLLDLFPGFDLNAVDELHRSYIQQLLRSPRFDEGLLEILLGADVDLENQDHAGETAIFNAICQQPTTKAARMLLDRGANMNLRNHADTGLMHRIVGYYSESDAIMRAKALLELVPDFINDRDSQGRTALHKALFLGQMELVQALLAYNRNIDIVDRYARTAFVVACQYGRDYTPDPDDDLKPDLNHDPITPEEGELIEEMVAEMGQHWAEIACRLRDRSGDAVKNWWHGSMNRRRSNAQRRALME
ncbi:hypothetical protein KCU99_g8652, partial [Aureobasidium melanogenum]